jgi:hypothetical protein
MRIITILSCLGAVAASVSWASGNSTRLDLSEIGCSAEIVDLVRTYIPPAIENELVTSDLAPAAFNSQIAAVFFPTCASDTSRNAAVVYYSGGLRNHAIQYFRRDSTHWQLVAETDSVIGEAWLSVGASDVDCDGLNEIILSASEGADGARSIQILKIAGGKLLVITPQGEGQYLVGSYAIIKEPEQGCAKNVEVWLDSPVKYTPDRKRVYKLDAASKTYKMVEEVKLESSDKK